MGFAGKQKKSLKVRFSLAIVFSAVVFVAIFLALFVSFIQVRANIHRLAGVETRKIVEGTRLASDLGQFLARLQVLQATFYRNEDYLQEEGAYLLKLVKHHEDAHRDIWAQTTATSLGRQLRDFLEQCTKINDLLERQQQIDDQFNQILDEVHSRIEARQHQVLALAEVAQLERLAHQVAHYRIELLKIGRFSALPHLPLDSRLEEMLAELPSFSFEHLPGNEFAQRLTDLLEDYRFLLAGYQQELELFETRSATLSRSTEEALRQIEQIDWQNEQYAERAQKNIDATIIATGSVVLGLMTILALLLALIQHNLFSKHIRVPMEKIRKRLQALQQGDYSSPMVLDRDDEWGQIEASFNNMLADLVNSWSALQESEKRHRNFFDSAAEGIYQATLEGELLNMNPSMLELFGFEEGEGKRGDYPAENLYVNPADRQRMIERLKQEEIVTNFEVEMRRCNGEAFWAVINSHLVRDSEANILFLEGTVEDISKRRASEEALVQLKEYLHAIVDTMPSILIGVDDRLQVSLWNRKVARVTGVPEELALGRPVAEAFSLIDKENYLHGIEATLQSKNVTRLKKVPGSKGGEGYFFDLLIYPLRSQEISGAVIHMDDVTEKSHIEEVMVQSEKMLSVGSLAAGMAHEINNPLASVLQNVQVLQQRLSPALKKNQQVAEQLGISVEQVNEYARLRGFDQMIKSIAEAGQRAARIIENMLNFSRKSSSSFLHCSLADLVEKTIELAGSDYDMKHHFDFRTINVVRDFQPVPEVPCESSQIQQVILSLLKNAAQALGKTENPEITVRIFQEDEQVCLQIADNGEGMSEQVRRRIFEPFFTTKEVGRGTGLGLSVSYFLITQNHKGSLLVDSQPGEGTCFSVYLPLVRT